MAVFIAVTVLLLVSCIGTSLAVDGSKGCNAEHCDPNWTPFDNMVAALRGYNIRTGNPIQNNGDPGFAGQIFLPTKLNNLGRVELERGITASELSFCQRTMTSRSFSTIESYRKYVTQASSSGIDLQVGTDTEVTAGISIKAVELSATKTIPKPFERAWGDSGDFKDLTKFFSEKQGMISTSMGICTMYEVKLDRFNLPPFRPSFKKALTMLYDSKNKGDHIKKSKFRLFIEEYGTHYLLRTKMGAQYVYRTKYSKTARESMNCTVLEECNYVKGAQLFGIKVEKDRKSCSNNDKEKLHNLGTSNVESSIITKGSRPTDIEHWASQDFVPVPLKFKLSPIINLMTDYNIEVADMTGADGVKITGKDIREWFVPLYFDYCKTMQIKDCGEEKGCGIDDKCPIDAICDAGEDVHECSEWSEWKCTVNCGEGTHQRRTRTCTGCKGPLEQTRKFKCTAEKECRYKEILCQTKYTPWSDDGGGKVQNLDKHNVNCGKENTISMFQLTSNARGSYRYIYNCCSTPATCRLISKYTPYDITVGRGAVYIDRHPISCRNHYLSAFKLENGDSNGIRYNYKCCEMPEEKSCYVDQTEWSADGGGDDGDIVYLDSHQVSCRDEYGLTYFRLQRNKEHDQWRYSFKCCKTIVSE